MKFIIFRCVWLFRFTTSSLSLPTYRMKTRIGINAMSTRPLFGSLGICLAYGVTQVPRIFWYLRHALILRRLAADARRARRGPERPGDSRGRGTGRARLDAAGQVQFRA